MKNLTASIVTALSLISSPAMAGPSGAIGYMSNTVGLMYGTYVPAGGDELFMVQGGGADVFCGIQQYPVMDRFIWTGFAFQTPVVLHSFADSVYSMLCISSPGKTFYPYLIYSGAIDGRRASQEPGTVVYSDDQAEAHEMNEALLRAREAAR